MVTYPHTPQPRLQIVLDWFATNAAETPETLRQARHDLARAPEELHAWHEVAMGMPEDASFFVTVQSGQ